MSLSSVGIQLGARWQFWKKTHLPRSIASFIILSAMGPWCEVESRIGGKRMVSQGRGWSVREEDGQSGKRVSKLRIEGEKVKYATCDI